jgi:hypothetical protein
VRSLSLALALAVTASGACKRRQDEAPPPPPPPGTPGVDPRLVIGVDRRVELVSIVSRLAGYREYSVPARTAYMRDVDAHFAAWRDHPAVATARALHAEHGIAYNAPIGLAVYLDENLVPRRPLTPPLPGLDDRWNSVDLDPFVVELADFARVSGLDDFLAAHATFSDAVATRVGEALDGYRIVDWFDGIFGPRQATFRVIPGLLTGDNAYAAFAVGADGQEEIVQVLALPPPGADGVPRPNRETIYLLAHEFSHSYVNPAMDARREQVLPAAEPAFARMEVAMRKQNYPQVRHMVNESVVRALVVLYARERGGEGAGERQALQEYARSFVWTQALADALAAVRARHGGRLPPDEMATATRDTFAAWAAAHPP